MFLQKEQEETLKLIVKSYIEQDFLFFRDAEFEKRINVLQNTLDYVRHMTMETPEDAEFRVAAVSFCDNLLLNLSNDRTPFGMPDIYKDVYTISLEGPWTNYDLIKEKNLNGYFLAKLMGGEPHFPFGDVNVEYSFLKYVSDMDFPYIKPADFTHTTLQEYIIRNANTMDVLILSYPTVLAAFCEQVYRQNRKNGKVIINADTNRHGITQKFQMLPEYVQPFFTNADVVTVASKNLRDMLNGDPENKFPTFSLTKGFANATGEDLTVTPSDKENVIFTAGRLYDVQKNAKGIIDAFAKASELLPGWKLALAGAINPRTIAEIMKPYPHLVNRIEFLGDLEKDKLYEQYKRAKIFCMPSLWDNMPNVCIEALAFGCYLIVPDSMDGAAELTRNGEFGTIYEQEQFIVRPKLVMHTHKAGYSGEAETNLANALIDTSHKLDYNFFKTHIPKAKFLQQTEFDYTNNVRKLALLMFA
ncbi:MAG: glycosyltransferase family 4 protein [Ruminococcus sp.]|jgi:glycosyltransferase involved in cell wall biosynthesis|nr:glycosyltransferase family 4 protein [Ruminococcus sp.]